MAAKDPRVTVALSNLPHQPTLFIGREREVEAVRDLVLREGVQLVTLTGPGGMGKTRLAVQVAASFLSDEGRRTPDGQQPASNLPHFSDGACFVSLAAISDSSLVASSIAETLGVMEAGDKDRPLVESLKAHLRDKRLLLVLDNFEQVLEASTLVIDLIAAAPHLKVLVTSRERLHLRGEHELPVPPLAVPDGRWTMDESSLFAHQWTIEESDSVLSPQSLVLAYEAVRLFVERATAIRPDFRLDGDSAGAVVEICRRLDGLPLAIELAAARMKVLTPQAILSHLDNRLKLLTSGERDLPTRHRTLRATIGWSYDLLDDPEKALFRRLSVFSGGGSLEAIEAICAPQLQAKGYWLLVTSHQPPATGEVLDSIASLVDKNLLRQDVDAGAEPRFSMLETIGEYAREKLEESSETHWLHRLHADYFLAFAEKAEPELKGPKQVDWLRRLEAEHDNMRGALRWSIDAGERELSLRLGAVLHGFWRMRGHLTEGRAWLESALAGVTGAPTPAQGKALMAAGTLASSQGDFARAKGALEESLTIFRELGDMESVASALRNLGNELRYRGDLEGSSRAFEEALEIARALDKRWDVASILGDLGIVAQTLGKEVDAHAMYRESLALRREMNDTRGIAMMLVNLGELARAHADYDGAEALYREALGLARQLGDKWGVGMVLHNLGHVAYHRRDYIHAWNLFAESLGIFHELHNKRDIAYCLAALGGLYSACKQPERAAVLFSAANAIQNTISSHLDPADQVEYERNVRATQEQLTQAEWDRAWIRGQALTLDDAVAYSLERPPSTEQTAPLVHPPKVTAPLILTTRPLAEPPVTLTERESEVLRLVAEGLADAEVARQLGISTRTVNRHLSSTYSKLDVTSRTAAVRAANERGLL